MPPKEEVLGRESLQTSRGDSSGRPWAKSQFGQTHETLKN